VKQNSKSQDLSLNYSWSRNIFDTWYSLAQITFGEFSKWFENLIKVYSIFKHAPIP